MSAADGSGDELKAALLRDAEVALCAGRAGVQIIDAELLKASPGLLAVADVNAVPPAGVAGLDQFSDGAADRRRRCRGDSARWRSGRRSIRPSSACSAA